ncbi:disintegrin and metalloproteinase domain-containing protein 20-like [Dipodomys merriami]|uniref:disintegrin and metalloproteinase domain-containing protein 20-like n=1 Tax=Dipodomys merriami TaxID=94247 RepID=UPI00384C413C
MLIMAACEALEQVKFTLLLFYLWVFFFLSTWTQTGHAQFYSPPEVVIPLRVTGMGEGTKTAEWITYEMNFGGKRHTVRIKNSKYFVSRDFSVFTYSDKGELLQDHPFVQSDCYYRGYVDQDPKSLVTLSTCLGGFHGMLSINNIVYEIKPKNLSTTFEHLLYTMDVKETQSQPTRCGLTEKKAPPHRKFQGKNNTTLMQSSYLGWWIHRWFLELAIVVDHERFVFCGSNVSTVEMEVVLGVGVVDELYNALDVDMVLVAIEVWNTQNPIGNNSPYSMMLEFCLWKEISFNSRVPHDAAHIIVKQHFCEKRSTYSYFAGVCSYHDNCGLECVVEDGFVWLSVRLSHELGHTLGIFDDEESCKCEQDPCIMNEHILPADSFSNCSYGHFFQTVATKKCLYNSPNPEHTVKIKLCGNGVVEDDEECDCGSLKTCVTDPCCFENCTLKAGAKCAFGLCCRNCQFLPLGQVCRAKNGVCDLPEWCNGSSNMCPEDVYVEDGLSCLDKGICYKKRCNDRESHCKHIFGEEAKSANHSCYLAVNTQGNRFGHCGFEDTNYKSCDPADVLCGRIQCESVTETPLLGEHNTAYAFPVGNTTCWGTDYHFGMTIPDIGEVKDGTECGLGLMCMNKKCVPFPVWEEACLADACNRRGVCNNKHHCHCNPGWAPPNCLEHGHGGSVDSGPAPRRWYWYVFQVLLIWICIVLLCTLCSLCLLALLRRRSEKEEEERKEEPASSVSAVSAASAASAASIASAGGKAPKAKTPHKTESKVKASPSRETQKGGSISRGQSRTSVQQK